MLSDIGPHRSRADCGRERTRRLLRLERLCDRRVLVAVVGLVSEDIENSVFQEVFTTVGTDAEAASRESLDLSSPFHLRSTINLEGVDDTVIESLSSDQTKLLAFRDHVALQIDLNTGGVEFVDVGASIASLHSLPDGRLLALGSKEAGLSGDAAWLVSFADHSVDAIDFGLTENETGWASAAIDDRGHGLLIAAGNDEQLTPIRKLVWQGNAVDAVETVHLIGPEGIAMTTASATTSLLAVPNSTGLSVTAWSNSSGGPLTNTSVDLPGIVALHTYDGFNDLAIAEDVNGAVLVLDSAADFAPLNRFTNLSFPVALDSLHERLIGIDDLGNLIINDLATNVATASIPLDQSVSDGIVLADQSRIIHRGPADRLGRFLVSPKSSDSLLAFEANEAIYSFPPSIEPVAQLESSHSTAAEAPGIALVDVVPIPQGIVSQPTCIANVELTQFRNETVLFELSDARFEIVQRKLLIKTGAIVHSEDGLVIGLTIRAYVLQGTPHAIGEFHLAVQNAGEDTTTGSFMGIPF